MINAAQEGARVVHLPETSLPGYGPVHFKTFADYSWSTLDRYERQICALALSLDQWIILGSMRRVDQGLPRNCILVISNKGNVVSIYDKQRLYKEEKKYYSAGNKPLVTEINGYRCGFLICYDNCYPELYEEYRNLGVEILFHSFHNAGNRVLTSIKDVMLANLIVRAADNRMYISASNSSRRQSPLAACIVRPDGTMVKTSRNTSAIVVDTYPVDELGWTYDNRFI
jgi:predicted amidohydrolase